MEDHQLRCAAEELVETTAGAVNPALGRLLRAARGVMKEHGERDAVDDVEAHRFRALARALEPFAGLETEPTARPKPPNGETAWQGS